MKFLAIFLACIFVTARSSHADDICDLITITSSALATNSGKKFICPSTRTISFQCTVINTSTLVWDSDEYIGEKYQIIFNVELGDRKGAGKTVDQKSTFAQLLNVECSSESVCKLTSDLRITEVLKSSVSVQCGYNSTFCPMNIVYSAIPNKPRLLEPLLLVQNERNSFFQVQWEPSNNSNSFELDYYHLRVQYSNGSDYNITFLMNNGTIISVENGSVIVSIATISTCGQESQHDSKLIHSTINPEDEINQYIIEIIMATVIVLILFGKDILMAILCCLTKKRRRNRFMMYGVDFVAMNRLRAGMKAIATLFIPQDQSLDGESESLLQDQQEISTASVTESLPDLNLQKDRKPTSDLDPSKMAICNTFMRIFERHGAVALKTPFLEHQDITDKKYQSEGTRLFHFIPHGRSEERYTLRYDLTVPFARYLARNHLTKMKRYQIDGVYRNDKRAYKDIGTSWEYYQCDFDIAGDFDSMVPDAECLKIIVEILSELKFENILIKVSHCKIVQSILINKCGCSIEEFKEICTQVENDPDHDWVKVCIRSLKAKFNDFEVLKEYMKESCQLNDLIQSGLLDFAKEEMEEIKKLSEYCQAFGINENVYFDLSLSFRLGYYTGLIFEAFTETENKQTSLAAGGRYDRMVKEIPHGQNVPCVGFTVNIEEIFNRLSKRENMNLESVRIIQTQVFVASDEGNLKERMELCAKLWKANIHAEFTYREAPKLDEQLQYCDENDIPFCVIFKHGKRKIRDVKKGCEECVPNNDDVITKLTKQIRERKEMSLFIPKPAT